MTIQNYLSDNFSIFLNSEQIQGVEEINKNCLLLAVPGSGKTTVLVSRVANLIISHKIAPSNILLLTFSKEACNDIKRRFAELFSLKLATQINITTIHSFCLGVMRNYASIYNRNIPKIISVINGGSYKKNIIRNIYKQITGEFLTEDIFEYIEKNISFVKNMCYTDQQLKKEKFEINCFYEIFIKYEEYKTSNSFIDFDDMLVISYKILRKFPKILEFYQDKYKYVNLDEAQDTTKIQHEIIKLISKKSVVFMVGDEDQTIYSFLGAYPKALLEFSNLYKNSIVLKMEHNYRSNSDIVQKANSFIKRNKMRYAKEMYCNNKNSSSIKTIRLNDFSEQYDVAVKLIKDKDKTVNMAFLYRNNDSAIAIIDKLLKENISFYIKENSGSFFNSMVVRDINAFIKLAFNMSDLESFKQISYKIGINKSILEYVNKNHAKYNNIFDCILDFDMLSDKKQYFVEQLAVCFKRLTKMTSINALNFIENDLGYKKFIITKLGMYTNIGIGFMQKLNTLKSIAYEQKNIFDFFSRIKYLQTCMQQNMFNNKDSKVYLSTIHSAKGLEFDEVVLIDMIQNILPSADAIADKLDGEIEPIENESRLFYVAVTRAKTKLYIFISNNINNEKVKTSKFIEEFTSEKIEKVGSNYGY